MVSEQMIKVVLNRYRNQQHLPHDRIVGRLIDHFGMRVGGNKDMYKVWMIDDFGCEITSWQTTLNQAVVCVMDKYYGAKGISTVLRPERKVTLSWGERLYKDASVAGSDSKAGRIAEEAVSAR